MTAEVRVAHRGDAEGIARVLSRAFFDDPVGCYFFPDETRRADSLERFFSLQLRRYYFKIGEVYTTEPYAGASLWLAPTHGRSSLFDSIALLGVFRIVSGRVQETSRFGAMLAANRPKTPHFYLGTIGVEPARQDHGMGSALMQPVLARCDAERIPAYLECSKQETVAFYERHGFIVNGEIVTPRGGPRIWQMWRDPLG